MLFPTILAIIISLVNGRINAFVKHDIIKQFMFWVLAAMKIHFVRLIPGFFPNNTGNIYSNKYRNCDAFYFLIVKNCKKIIP